jgi:hypothetical protein
MKNFNIEEEVEKTLGSLDGVKRVEANPYLYGRISSRMQTYPAAKKHVLGFVIVAILILLINIVTLISYNKDKPVITRDQKVKAFIYDYNLESDYNINY